MSIVLLVILLFFFVYWPSIMYHFNLYHSKSLPYLSENFVGREREIEELMQFMDFKNSTVRIINIIGSPGFGKSTLAMHVGHAVVKRGDVVHYINMADFPEKDVKLILSEKVMETARVIAKHIDFGTLLRWARKHYYNNLLILDNCDKVIYSQKQEFDDAVNKLVEESIRIKVIFTSRTLEPFLDYYRWVKIDELSEWHAHKLLESKLLSRVNITQEEMQQIANYTGNVPLALHIIGSLLCLPHSPTPRKVIQELQMNPMKILTPKKFPANKQMFTTIHLSYTYLSKETQKIGRQITLFPGSFTWHAAKYILCTSDSLTDCNEVLDELVKNSLLEYDQRIRSERYQYHQLIRDFFLHIQRSDYPHEHEQLLPAFHIHYSNMLMYSLRQFNYRYEKSLAMLDSERHNIQHLFEVKQNLSLFEFVVTVVALSKGIEVGLLSLRFSNCELCSSIKSYLNRYDWVVDMQLDDLLQNRTNFLQPFPFDILQGPFSKEMILTQYMLLIDLVAKCEEDTHDTEFASVIIYEYRRYIVQRRSKHIQLLQFVKFFTILSEYYSQQGDDTAVIECHRLMIMQTDSHLATCEQHSRCDYYDVGVAYYKMHKYEKAITFFEQALNLTSNVMDRFKIMIQLINTYDSLKSVKVKSIFFELDIIVQHILCCIHSKIIFRYSIAVQDAIDLYTREGFDKVAVSLEDKLLSSVEEEDFGIVLTSQSFEWHKSKKQVPVGIIYRVINHLFEAKKYSRAVEKGMHFIAIFNKTSHSTKEVVQFRILVGQAMFHGGNYSKGMDQMELALRVIDIEILKGHTLYEREKAIACVYLILRLKYIDHCYNINIRRLVTSIGSFILHFLFSPSPLPHICFIENLQLKHATSLSTYASESVRTELVVRTPGIGLFPSIHYEIVEAAITSMTDDYYTPLKNYIVKLFTMLTNYLITLYRFLLTPLWIIIVWMKLMGFRSCKQRLYDIYYCLTLPYSMYFALRYYSECRYNLRAMLQCLGDPRFMYGMVMSSLVHVLPDFVPDLIINIPILIIVMTYFFIFMTCALIYFNVQLTISDPGTCTCYEYYYVYCGIKALLEHVYI